MSLIPRQLEKFFPGRVVPNKKNLLEIVKAVPEAERGPLMHWLCLCFTRYMSHPIGQAFQLVWQESDNPASIERAALYFVLADETDYKSQKDLSIVKNDFLRILAWEEGGAIKALEKASVRSNLLLALFRYDWVFMERPHKSLVIRWYFRALLSSDPLAALETTVPTEISHVVEALNVGGHAEHAEALRQQQIEAENSFRAIGLPDRADELKAHMERKASRALTAAEHRRLVGRA